MISHDRARQLAKAYVGAINTDEETLSALLAPAAVVRVDGTETRLAALHAVAPPRRSSLAGRRLEGDCLVVVVRVRDRTGEERREHRLAVDEAGWITAIDA